MSNNIWVKMGLTLALLVVVGVGYGGACNQSDDTTSGSSGQVTVAAPSNLTATNTAGTIMVTWQDNSNNETNFYFYVKAFGAPNWTLASNVIPADATSYSFLANTLGGPGSNFQFCLTAYDGNDVIESAASNIISISW